MLNQSICENLAVIKVSCSFPQSVLVSVSSLGLVAHFSALCSFPTQWAAVVREMLPCLLLCNKTKN